MRDKSRLITALRWIGRLIPGTYLRTLFYRVAIAKTRRALRAALHAFYRMDHVYDVLEEARRYRGSFSILEFGTADGYALTKILYATRYMRMEDRVTVHGFDSFEGMPEAGDPGDEDLVTGDGWVKGEFRGRLEALERHCRARYGNFRLHPGWFDETLTEDFLASLSDAPPILVWIDCDYYSSASCVMERLIPHLPSGCVVYFDDYDFNFGSRFSGEARVIDEVNRGLFGEDVELVPDRRLGLDSDRVYRFVKRGRDPRFRKIRTKHHAGRVRQRGDGSPLP